jgi:hypothetical protein
LCVWVKDNAGMGSLYRSQHELVLVFKQRGGAHRNNIQLGQFGRNRSNIWHYPGGQLNFPRRRGGQSASAAPDGEAGGDGRRCDPRLHRARRDRARRLWRQRHNNPGSRARRPRRSGDRIGSALCRYRYSPLADADRRKGSPCRQRPLL